MERPTSDGLQGCVLVLGSLSSVVSSSLMPSPFHFLRAGPPPPRVALLPDAAFFTRTISIAADATAAEAAAQVELALEAISPFPIAQLYYGWFRDPAAQEALVFAAYRRRFTTDQTAEWEGAEVVRS